MLADDATVIRQGLARLLADSGLDIVAQVGNAAELIASVDAEQPDIAIVDIRMPPTYTDEGLVAATRSDSSHPAVGVLVLSQHVDVAYAMKLLTEDAERVGYLLKDRIVDVPALVTILHHIADGGSDRRPRPRRRTGSHPNTP